MGFNSGFKGLNSGDMRIFATMNIYYNIIENDGSCYKKKELP